MKKACSAQWGGSAAENLCRHTHANTHARARAQTQTHTRTQMHTHARTRACTHTHTSAGRQPARVPAWHCCPGCPSWHSPALPANPPACVHMLCHWLPHQEVGSCQCSEPRNSMCSRSLHNPAEWGPSLTWKQEPIISRCFS